MRLCEGARNTFRFLASCDGPLAGKALFNFVAECSKAPVVRGVLREGGRWAEAHPEVAFLGIIPGVWGVKIFRRLGVFNGRIVRC